MVILMWNWKEFYELLAKVRKHTQVLCNGEGIMQIPSVGENACEGDSYALLHIVSGVYRGQGKEISFCGYEAEKVPAASLVWLYLKRLSQTGEVLFNAVFMKDGTYEQEKARRRQQHGIRMVYKRMAHSNGEINQCLSGYSINGSFYKLAVIGCRETEIKMASIAELLHVFADAADERGMVVLAEENARVLCERHAEREEKLYAVK